MSPYFAAVIAVEDARCDYAAAKALHVTLSKMLARPTTADFEEAEAAVAALREAEIAFVVATARLAGEKPDKQEPGA